MSPVLRRLLYTLHLQEAISLAVWKARDVDVTMHQVEPILCTRPHGS